MSTDNKIPLNEIERNNQLKQLNEELKNNNNELQSKYKALKENVIELKQNLDTAVFKQLETKEQKILQTKGQIEEANNKINSLSKEVEDLPKFQATQKVMRQKYFSLLNDKMKNENLYLNQEDIIKDLKEKNNEVSSKSIELGNQIEKTNSDYSTNHMIYEEKKDIILNLQKQLNDVINSNKAKSKILDDKLQEIQNLRNLLNQLKIEQEQKLQNEQRLKNKLRIVTEKNKNLSQYINETSVNYMQNGQVNTSQIHNTSTSFIIKQHQQKQQRIAQDLNESSHFQSNIYKEQTSALAENEENNMNDIDGLMKSILEED